jgi:hypothetical protein
LAPASQIPSGVKFLFNTRLQAALIMLIAGGSVAFVAGPSGVGYYGGGYRTSLGVGGRIY